MFVDGRPLSPYSVVIVPDDNGNDCFAIGPG